MHFKLFCVAVVAIFVFLMVGSQSNLEDIKIHAEDRWEEVGFTVIGYEGYQWGYWLGGDYGGAKVWYMLSKDDNDITYTGYIKKWGDEYHIYGPRAIDAISPK